MKKEVEPCEYNNLGIPQIASPTTRPCATVTSGSAPSNTSIDQRTDLSVNKSMPWVALACSFGFLGFGTAIAVALMTRGQIEAEGRAVKAEIRAEFSQSIADVKAEARMAGTDAAIAKNTVQRLDIKMSK